jgi:hypothetical protein
LQWETCGTGCCFFSFSKESRPLPTARSRLESHGAKQLETCIDSGERASITAQRAEWIKLFLDSQNNTLSTPNGETAFMAGAWGLAEHSCSAAGIQVNFGKELSNLDCHGHDAKWGFRLCHVECELQVENDRLVWNYGEEFARTLDPCSCALCFKKKKLKK